MIIFGWGHTTNRDYGETYPLHCSNCHNTSYFRLVRTMVWFDLFFIPIFPYKIDYNLLCPICRFGIKMEDKRLEQIKEVNEITLKYLDKQMTEKQYNDKRQDYDNLFISEKIKE